MVVQPVLDVNSLEVLGDGTVGCHGVDVVEESVTQGDGCKLVRSVAVRRGDRDLLPPNRRRRLVGGVD